MVAAGIEMLQGINSKDIEIVQIDNTKYDDGSVCFSVNVTFPAIAKKESVGIGTKVNIDKVVDNLTKRLGESLSKRC